MNESAPHQRRESSGWGTWIALAIAFGPIFYILSIGPVARLSEEGLLPREPVRAFYQPVVWLHDHTPLEEPLEWYAALWGWR